MSKETKVRPTLRVEPKTAQRVEQWYKAANCRSQNEFMKRAINFYADYLEMNDNNDLLPQALQSYLDVGSVSWRADSVQSASTAWSVWMNSPASSQTALSSRRRSCAAADGIVSTP